MYQGTTPTLVLTVGEEQLDDCTCYVTLRQSVKKITKSGSELVVSGNEIAVRLTQQDTLSLMPGRCEIQVRWIDASGNAGETDKEEIEVTEALLKEIIEYQEVNNNG